MSRLINKVLQLFLFSDRYFVSSKITLAIIWLTALVLGFADFDVVVLKSVKMDNPCEMAQGDSQYCMNLACSDSVTQRAWWTVGLLSLVIMTFSYAIIFIRLFQSGTPLHALDVHNQHQHHQLHHSPRQSVSLILRRKKGLVTTMMILVSFLICTVPYSITEVFLKLTRPTPAIDSSDDLMTLMTVVALLQLFTLLNCFVNTAIYVVRMKEVSHGYTIIFVSIFNAMYNTYDFIKGCSCFYCEVMMDERAENFALQNLDRTSTTKQEPREQSKR